MVRALLLLAAAVPTVIYADTEATAPSCAQPASVEPRAPRRFGGDRIVFTQGTTWRTGVATLSEVYGLNVGFPAENWNLSDGVFVQPLTLTQIAQLRCDPVVERIVLGPRSPESLAQDGPPSKVRLGILFISSDQPGQPVSRGVFVTHVGHGSVAEKAGLLAKDRIIKFDGHAIDSAADLLNVMATKNPGDTVGMVVIRDGSEQPLVAQF